MATVTQHQQQETATSNNTTTGAPSTTTFTPEQRDRQARGKNPYEDPMEYWKETLENYHERERKDFAIAALTSPEKLLMYAQAEDDVSFLCCLASLGVYRPKGGQGRKEGKANGCDRVLLVNG